MRISVIGTGYVGLVAGACLADTGNKVYCIDIDRSKIDSLKEGKIPIFEPGLGTLIKRNFAEGRLIFTTSYQESIPDSEVLFLAVGTPSLPNGEPDLSYLKSAVEEIARTMNGYKILVNKSTVPIGSHRLVEEWIKAKNHQNFDVVSNPEFLKEGTAVDDFMRPDRVVIGTTKQSVYEKISSLYTPFVRQGNPILWMNPVSAEMTKYACNAFLATKISFMNELALLCEKVGGDIEEVRKGMTTDLRIGRHFLYAGTGYGGSCFPKDILALAASGRKEGVNLGIVSATESANQRQKKHLASRVKGYFGENLQGKKFAIWGLAFKPNTDDMREAPSVVIIEDLLNSGAEIHAFDPVATENAQKIFGKRIHFCTSNYEAIEGADALIIVTEWNEFRSPDFGLIKKSLRQPVIFDGRNLYNSKQMREDGFLYFGIGRR